MIACWSVKGGSGVSVVSAALALTLSRRSPVGGLFVDLDGDGAAVLGEDVPHGPGVGDWLSGGPDVAVDALPRLERELGSGLSYLAPGHMSPCALGRVDLFAGVLADERRPVVLDAGLIGDPVDGTPTNVVAHRLTASATHSWLVTRPCYLALRRVSSAPLVPSGVVLVVEPGRALGRKDVEDVVGAPVVAEVPVDPQVARSVDSGLLISRVPRVLVRALRHAA